LNEESGLGNKFRSSSEKIAKAIAETNESAVAGAKNRERGVKARKSFDRILTSKTAGGRDVSGPQKR